MLLTKVAYNLRGRWLAFRIRASGGSCGRNLRVEQGFRLGFPIHPGWRLGDNVYFGPNTLIDCPKGAILSIGNDVTFTLGTVIGAHQNVTIGSDVLVAEYVSIRDADHGKAPGQRIRQQPMETSPVSIGPDVWIGRGAAVLRGSTVGYGAIIAANAVCRGICLPYSINGGLPARQIGSRLGGQVEPLQRDAARVRERGIG